MIRCFVFLLCLGLPAFAFDALAASESKGFYKVGPKYTIKNKTYVPIHYDFYEDLGLASWYGKPFHGRKTANGEIFDLHALTAAHRLLPMPSIIRVQNLENGRSLVLKVNDRGPFVSENRILDVSEVAARILGFHKQGLAKVKVTYLRKATEQYIKGHRHYSKYYDAYRKSIVKKRYRRDSMTQLLNALKADKGAVQKLDLFTELRGIKRATAGQALLDIKAG